MSVSEIRTPDAAVPRPLHGLLVEFADVESFVAAVKRVRHAGYQRWDAHSPFPVHGMDDAMGIRGTQLPWLVLACGITGAGLGLLMQWWMNAHDYPLVISGKPFFGLPAAIPVTFELTVLLSALGTVIGMLVLNNLPQWHHPLLGHRRFRRVTSDRFCIVIEARDPAFDRARTAEFLGSLGGSAVEMVEG